MNKNYIDDYEFLNLIKEYGSPLYVYYEREIEKNIDILKNNFRKFDVFYSMKANPNVHICSFIKDCGLSMDAASQNEVEIAVRLGFEKNKIIYSSPGKTEEDIRYAIQKCIIIADSVNEIYLIDSICKEKNIKEKIGIRINPIYSMPGTGALEVMSGVPGKFGVDEEVLYDVWRKLECCSNISISGIQIYMGSQITDEKIIFNNFRGILDVVHNLYEKFKFVPEFIDFGGGFGVKYTDKDNGLDIEKSGKIVENLLNQSKYKMFKDTRLIVESGRFICASAGYYAAKVLDVKTSRGKNFAIIDGGMNTFFRPVFIKENKYPIHKAGKNNGERMLYSIAGIMCTPIDILAEEVLLPKLNTGDVVVFSNAGAYGYTMSLTKFISHKEASEIYISKNNKIFC